MTVEGPAKRRLPVGLIGAVLLLIAAVLLVAATAARRRPTVDADADARSSCRAFEDVYAATRPGAPVDTRGLARKLEQAMGEMHRAASADSKWSELARRLDDVGNAVNAGDARRAYAAMQAVHDGCSGAL